MNSESDRYARRGKPMISLDNLHKYYKVHGGRKVVLDGITCEFERGYSYGILGVNGAGKSTLLQLIAGSIAPNLGRIRRHVAISWPIGLLGAFNPNITARNNIKFVARAYGQDPRQTLDFVEEFTELGDYLDAPTKTYSSGMSSKLGFGLSMAIQFELYISDEATAVGDARFIKKCERAFTERRATADLLIVSHQVGTLKSFCDRGAVLVDGRLLMYNDVDAAIDIYNRLNR